MAGVLLGLTSCNDDKDELTDSRLTYYADLQLQGDEFMSTLYSPLMLIVTVGS